MNDFLLVVFTGVVAGSTVLYMIITGWLAWETRKGREAQTEPKVSVQLELNEQIGQGVLQLAIRNEGTGPAQDIKFEFVGNPRYFVGNGMSTPINEVPVIRDGLRYLGSGRLFTFNLGRLLGDDFKQANDNPWTFHVLYKTQTGKARKDKYVLDFSQFWGLFIGGGNPLRQMEQHLGDINKEFHNLGTGFHKPQIITQTKEESQREKEESQREWEAIRQQHMGDPNEESEPGSEASAKVN